LEEKKLNGYKSILAVILILSTIGLGAGYRGYPTYISGGYWGSPYGGYTSDYYHGAASTDFYSLFPGETPYNIYDAYGTWAGFATWNRPMWQYQTNNGIYGRGFSSYNPYSYW